MFTSWLAKKLKKSDLKHQLMACLEDYRSPLFPMGVTPLVKEVKYHQHTLTLTLPFACHSETQALQDYLSEQGHACELSLVADIQQARQTPQSIAGVKNIIAVASGKGGVGKSTTSVCLARALALEGAKVGLLDADIYGPSLPVMLGCPEQKPQATAQNTMLPVKAHGLEVNSLGFLVPGDDAAIWRGPMASNALLQLINETHWGDLDYLVIDLPPGTGDVQLTLTQRIPLTAAVVVTTPQNVALADAKKGIAMFNKVNVPVLGVVENMSHHICANCGHRDFIFGQGGGESLAQEFGAELLGQVGLHISLREAMDKGDMSALFEENNPIGNQYLQLAKQLGAKLFYDFDRLSPVTPEIIISDD